MGITLLQDSDQTNDTTAYALVWLTVTGGQVAAPATIDPKMLVLAGGPPGVPVLRFLRDFYNKGLYKTTDISTLPDGTYAVAVLAEAP